MTHPAASEDRRRKALARTGAPAGAVEQALAYCDSPFRLDALRSPVFPLADEAHLADWRRYVAEAAREPFAYLQSKLVHLNIPIREGISQSAAYASAVRRGEPFDEQAAGGRLALERPDQFTVRIEPHPAGALPVLFTPHRADFETLCRALANRCEPVPINASVNAQMIAGFTNWDRVARHRSAWAADRSPEAGQAGWKEEMARVAREEPHLFYDRFMLLGDAPYSGMPAADLGIGLDDDAWRQRSRTLRVEHEFTHYATKRLHGKMRLNLLDEIVADFCGFTLALGQFRARWFLAGLGLDAWPQVRPNGRVFAYRADLDDAAFGLVCAVAVQAASRLEDLGARLYAADRRSSFFLALASMSLDVLADEAAEDVFLQNYEAASRLTVPAAGV